MSGAVITQPESAAAPSPPAARVVALIGLTLALCYLVVLCGAYLGGHFLIDAQGRPIANDFVNVWRGGTARARRRAGRGLRLADAQGRRSPRRRPRLRELLRLALSADISVCRRGAGDAAVSRRRDRLACRRRSPPMSRRLAAFSAGAAAFLVALGFPAALWNVTAGQNGFLTAALIGGTLGLLERRPALAGVCLGLLTYKPQFGLLFPHRADRRPALADHRGRRGGGGRTCRAVMARLRQRELGGFRALDADHQPRRARRRRTPIGAGCKACSAWSARMAAASRSPGAFRRRAAGARRCARLAVAKPRAVRSQGRRARRRHADRDALRLYVRPGRARGRRRLSAPLRARNADFSQAKSSASPPPARSS